MSPSPIEHRIVSFERPSATGKPATEEPVKSTLFQLVREPSPTPSPSLDENLNAVLYEFNGEIIELTPEDDARIQELTSQLADLLYEKVQEGISSSESLFEMIHFFIGDLSATKSATAATEIAGKSATPGLATASRSSALTGALTTAYLLTFTLGTGATISYKEQTIDKLLVKIDDLLKNENNPEKMKNLEAFSEKLREVKTKLHTLKVAYQIKSLTTIPDHLQNGAYIALPFINRTAHLAHMIVAGLGALIGIIAIPFSLKHMINETQKITSHQKIIDHFEKSVSEQVHTDDAQHTLQQLYLEKQKQAQQQLKVFNGINWTNFAILLFSTASMVTLTTLSMIILSAGVSAVGVSLINPLGLAVLVLALSPLVVGTLYFAIKNPRYSKSFINTVKIKEIWHSSWIGRYETKVKNTEASIRNRKMKILDLEIRKIHYQRLIEQSLERPKEAIEYQLDVLVLTEEIENQKDKIKRRERRIERIKAKLPPHQQKLEPLKREIVEAKYFDFLTSLPSPLRPQFEEESLKKIVDQLLALDSLDSRTEKTMRAIGIDPKELREENKDKIVLALKEFLAKTSLEVLDSIEQDYAILARKTPHVERSDEDDE